MVDEKALETAVRVWIDAEPGPDTQSERNAMRAAITAYLQALSPGSTGETEGWVLVPKEPTEEMMDAAIAVTEKPCFPQDIYRAMLSAAGER